MNYETMDLFKKAYLPEDFFEMAGSKRNSDELLSELATLRTPNYFRHLICAIYALDAQVLNFVEAAIIWNTWKGDMSEKEADYLKNYYLRLTGTDVEETDFELDDITIPGVLISHLYKHERDLKSHWFVLESSVAWAYPDARNAKEVFKRRQRQEELIRDYIFQVRTSGEVGSLLRSTLGCAIFSDLVAGKNKEVSYKVEQEACQDSAPGN